MSGNESLIRVENLQKHYNKGAIKALDGINTEIKKGEVVVVIGPSGSGKSTFLRCLNLLEVPTGGHIYFDGVDITDRHQYPSSENGYGVPALQSLSPYDHFEKYDHCAYETAGKKRSGSNRTGNEFAAPCWSGR